MEKELGVGTRMGMDMGEGLGGGKGLGWVGGRRMGGVVL